MLLLFLVAKKAKNFPNNMVNRVTLKPQQKMSTNSAIFTQDPTYLISRLLQENKRTNLNAMSVEFTLFSCYCLYIDLGYAVSI